MRTSYAVLALLLFLFIAPQAFAERPGDEASMISQTGPASPGAVIYDAATAFGDEFDYQQNCDGTFENGYAWSHAGVEDPYYGAFAERFTGPAAIQGARFYLTQSGLYSGQTTDVFVWGPSDEGPGTVLQINPGVVFDAIAFWPSISAHDVGIHTFAGEGSFYVGCQGNWHLANAGYYWAVDLDGPGGSPWTCIAPGIEEYPTGWSDPSIVWGSTRSMGIGVYVTRLTSGVEEPGDPPKYSAMGWGQVKSLFAR